MSAKLEALRLNLQKHLAERIGNMQEALGELTVDVDASEYLAVMTTLRDEPELRFEELMDLCGVDYSAWANAEWTGKRYAAVSHLVSITHNWRLRVRCFAPDDDFPSIPSLVPVSVPPAWNFIVIVCAAAVGVLPCAADV